MTARGAAEFRIACIPGSRLLLARLREAVGPSSIVESFDDAYHALPKVVRTGFDVTIVVVSDGTFDSALGTIRQLREAVPSLPVVAWVDMRERSTKHLVAIAQQDVDELLLRDVDDSPFAIRQVLTGATQRSTTKAIEARLREVVPTRIQPYFNYALERAHEPLTVDAVAAAFGISRRTLRNRFVERGCPGPRLFLTWCRLLIAASLLDERGRSLESVAYLLDFSSGHAFGELLLRYVGQRITSLREGLVSEATENAFRRAMAAAVLTTSPSRE